MLYALMLRAGSRAVPRAGADKPSDEWAERARWRRLARRAVAATLAIGASAALPAAAGAAGPSHVASTLEGCKVTRSIALPSANGDFVCPDSAYTSGNLGKFWNELDLVPYRVTLAAGGAAPATQAYSLSAVLDNEDAGRPGYDVISVLTLNSLLSSPTCEAATDTGQRATTGFGGIDTSIYRTFTVTQRRSTTCVYDYYGRLALGSHLFPGSALHANLAGADLTAAGIGASDVSIPVNEILPQGLTKDMSALRDSDHAWSIAKGAQPDHVDFPDTCDPGAALSAGVAVTIKWTKLAATPAGESTVVTHVYAENPASRTIAVTATDAIRSGTTTLDTAAGSTVEVPANTTMLVLSHTMTVPSDTTDLNDVATASYVDRVTGISVPGTTQATASATIQDSGERTNAAAVISDAEQIGGPFEYSADAFDPDIGSFQDGYVAGTRTSDPTDWLSSSQGESGSVTFSKTVYAAAGSSGSGTLSDTATLTGSNGFEAQAGASVGLVSSRSATISIVKHIPNVLSGDETASFDFDIVDAAGNVVETRTLTFAAGETTQSVDVRGITPGVYTVAERPTANWLGLEPAPVDVTTACTAGVELTGTFAPATAQVRKVTQPAGFESGWAMTLTGPRDGGETVVTGDDGSATFEAVLQEGRYTIAEAAQAGWDAVGAGGDCSFTVDYPADADRAFSCTLTNRKRGHVSVSKTLAGSSDLGTMTFAFELRSGASPTAVGTTLESRAVSAADNPAAFATGLVPGDAYQLCERLPGIGWMTSLFADGGFAPNIAADPLADNSLVCHDFTVQAGELKTIAVDNTPPPGGLALTIGYWKNHATCASSNGKQKQALDDVLASFAIAGGQAKPGVYIGNLYVDTCAEAVSLLNKSTVAASPKKMASDPAYNLASQLMAVELNLQGGAGACGGLPSYRAQSQALLSKYAFNGTSPYTTGASKMTAADQSLANVLASKLDHWNNDTLC